MSLKHGPKARSLTPSETLATFEIWRQNIIYGLRLNHDFRPYLVDGFEWGRKSRLKPTRNLTDVPEVKDVSPARSKEDQVVDVDLLLDQIANYAPMIPRNDIVRDCGSLDEVWQKIRLYYNLQSTGSLLNECFNIKRQPEETPQALYARLKQSFDENLITRNGLTHVDGKLTEDEEMSPTLHCTIVLLWLQLLHPKLRDLVTQRFATELRGSTYAALFPEISRSIEMLLSEVDSECTLSCKNISTGSFRRGTPFRGGKPSVSGRYQRRCCDYCKITGRRAFNTHNIDDCLFLRKEAQRPSQARAIGCDDGVEDVSGQYEEYYEEYDDRNHNANRITEHVINRVAVNASPVLSLMHRNNSYEVTLDSGATCNLLDKPTAEAMKCKIRSTNQKARMADGKTNLDIIGETDVSFYRDDKVFTMTALVSNITDTQILGGMSFMRENDIAIRPATDEIILDGVDVIKYNPRRLDRPSSIRRVKHYTVQSSYRKVILPGESTLFNIPPQVASDGYVAIEPRLDSACNKTCVKDSLLWPLPQVVKVVNGSISLVNDSQEPVIVKKHDQICLLQQDCTDSVPDDYIKEVIDVPKKQMKKSQNYSELVSLNPDNVLSHEESVKFRQMLNTYDEVFDPTISQYNGKSGPCFVEVNMGSTLPPQRKGKVPFYGRDNMMELQNKIDSLKEKGVFARPQEIGVQVENINTSFLVRKPSNPAEKRLVTDFGSITAYCRPTPSLMPDVDSVLRRIAAWKYIITTDLTEAYFQIPLKKSSMKYCGIVSPFKGLLVYCVGCMGLPGVEVALEELTCLIFGDMVKDGRIAKLADDIYIGGETVEDLSTNYEMVLSRLLDNNLRLSARKTVIAPRSVNILGWIWTSGHIRASPHRLSALAECKPPTTVSEMKSFVGAYRFLSRVLKGYAALLAPLETAMKGKTSGRDSIVWTDELTVGFKKAQQALNSSKTLTIPTPQDTLWIVTDASVKPGAVGATLYTVRDGTPKLSGFFNAKLKEFQTRWLPCEVEGIAIGAALHHYAPYIIQSKEKTQVLTDSKPCVQAVEKAMKGQFSTSARLSTFLSAVSRYQAQVRHIAGCANLPSDYSSRHPISCNDDRCQVCSFIGDLSDSVVLSITITDVIDGKVQLPYRNRKAWIEVQNECPDLRKVLTFKKNGTSPNKKSKNMRTVRRYLSSKVLIAADGLLVHKQAEPFSTLSERIVVPEQVLHGLLTALHLRLSHPSAHQLQKVFERYFYTLNTADAVSIISKTCYHCASIRDVPKAMIEQSSCNPPSRVGINLAADIMKRSKQLIFVLRETTTSYTLAEIIPDETVRSVAQALVKMCSILRPVSVTELNVRVDPAPAHQSLFKDLRKECTLSRENIRLEIGRILNINKNPVAEKAIKELQRELLSISPTGAQINPVSLSLAVANLNSRIRAPGLSAHELWTQRDQVTGDQLPIDDSKIIASQQYRRGMNHLSSEKSKACGKLQNPTPNIQVGSLVYTYSDHDKLAARQRYLVISIDGEWCKLKRFTLHQFGSKTYDAKLNECYLVPVMMESYPVTYDVSDTDSEDISSEDEASGVDSRNAGPEPPEELIQPPTPPAPRGRPRRTVRIPGRYDDFILEQ